MRTPSHLYYEACEGREEWPDHDTRELVQKAVRLAVREAAQEAESIARNYDPEDANCWAPERIANRIHAHFKDYLT